jgi:hypothetical protein
MIAGKNSPHQTATNTSMRVSRNQYARFGEEARRRAAREATAKLAKPAAVQARNETMPLCVNASMLLDLMAYGARRVLSSCVEKSGVVAVY